MGNLSSGKHELVALFVGQGPNQRDYRRGATLKFDKSVGPKYIELKIVDKEGKQQPDSRSGNGNSAADPSTSHRLPPASSPDATQRDSWFSGQDPPRQVLDLHYGEVLFYFYQGDYFDAITRSLSAQQQQQVPHHQQDTAC